METKQVPLRLSYLGSVLMDVSNFKIHTKEKMIQFDCSSDIFDLGFRRDDIEFLKLSASIRFDDTLFRFKVSDMSIEQYDGIETEEYRYTISNVSGSRIVELYKPAVLENVFEEEKEEEKEDTSKEKESVSLPLLSDLVAKKRREIAEVETKKAIEREETRKNIPAIIAFVILIILFFGACLYSHLSNSANKLKENTLPLQQNYVRKMTI